MSILFSMQNPSVKLKIAAFHRFAYTSRDLRFIKQNNQPMLNVVYDTNYTQLIPQGGFPYFDEKALAPKETPTPEGTAPVKKP